MGDQLYRNYNFQRTGKYIEQLGDLIICPMDVYVFLSQQLCYTTILNCRPVYKYDVFWYRTYKIFGGVLCSVHRASRAILCGQWTRLSHFVCAGVKMRQSECSALEI
jgi:hypothetical protein